MTVVGTACMLASGLACLRNLPTPCESFLPCSWQHFYAEPRAVREKLGWSSVLSLDDILDARFEEYVSKGRYEKEMSFELDDKILAAVGKSV